MSELGSQVDALREAADEASDLDYTELVNIGWMRDTLAPMLREAADTIESLRDRLQDAEAMIDHTCDTCENISKYAKECNHFTCSECGCTVEDAEGYYVSVHKGNCSHQLPWSFCPNCGARVRKAVER